MTLLGFKTILHKKCRSGKNLEGPAENSWVLSSKMKTNFKKSATHISNFDDIGQCWIFTTHFWCRDLAAILKIADISKIIQIHPCLLKLSRKQESVTDRRTAVITISLTVIAGDNYKPHARNYSNLSMFTKVTKLDLIGISTC